jgi:hypothetical protein
MSEHQMEPPAIPRLDALVVAVLALARIRIDTLAEAAVLPTRIQDVMRHPFLGRLLPEPAMALLSQQQLADPIALLLIVATIACLLVYLLVDELTAGPTARYRVKMALLVAIITLTVVLPSVKLILLRQQSGPASYSHDGGVIQTEATISYLWQGRNPYVEDYLNTPMAEWGITEFRTALYHYPYLPWTFLFSAPFERMSVAFAGAYDQRLVYLLLFAMTLALLPGLAVTKQRSLLLVAVVGLNPITGSDLIYGQNDSFILAWIVLSLWLWARGLEPGRGRAWHLAAAAVFGLACASKPTAWFLAPFYALLVAGAPERDVSGWLGRIARWFWPATLTFLLAVGPHLLWNPAAMIDDVWRWSSGTSETAYQIWGWGGSNLLLATGAVADRFAYWPFWLPELLVAGTLLVIFLRRQARQNRMGPALWRYALLLLAFFFVSRFLNENYLGYILAFLALGALADRQGAQRVAEIPSAGA